MSRKGIRSSAAAAAALIAIGGGAASGGETDRARYDFALGSERPATPSAVSLSVFFKDPEDPDAKPPALDGAELELPPGMRIDDGAVPRCDASDDEFEMQGRDACPPETQVGAGAVTVMTGLPGADPQTLDIVAFNGDGELIEVVFFPDTNVVAGIDRVTIEDDRLVAHPPSPPGGPPDGRTAIRELRLEVPRRIGPEGRAYVTTPPDCADGEWTSRGHFEFGDGGTTVVPSTTACTPEATALPALRVSVEPRRVRAGRRKTFEIVATSAERRCVRRARVRFGKRRMRTDRGGRAELMAKFRRAGIRRVRVSKRGCRSARARVRVMPRR